MQKSYKIIFFVFILSLLSCKEGIGEQREVNPEEKKPLDIEQRKLEKLPDTNFKRPTKDQQQEEFKKEKTKSSDTLRPLVAIP